MAGIIALEKGPYLGLIELPDGTQLLVRPGTHIGSDTTVVSISKRRIRLAFGTKMVDLDLEGADNEELVAGELVGSPVLQASANPGPGVAVRDVNASALKDLIDRTAASAGSTSVATTASAKAGPGAEDAVASLSGPIGDAIDLPDGGQLIAVNGKYVHTSTQGMQLIRASVSAGSTTTLTMSQDGGRNWERVYLNPREGAAADLEQMQQSSPTGTRVPVKAGKDSRS